MRNNITTFSNATFTTALTQYTNFVTNQRVNITSCIQVLHGGIHYFIVTYNFTV